MKPEGDAKTILVLLLAYITLVGLGMFAAAKAQADPGVPLVYCQEIGDDTGQVYIFEYGCPYGFFEVRS